MPEDQHSYSSYLFRRDLIQFQLANSRKIVSDLKQAGRGVDRGQGLCPPRYEHGNAADGYRPRSRRRSPRVSLLARNLCRCRRVARPGFSPGAASAAGDRRCHAPSARVSPALSAQRAPENPAAAARPGQASRANTGRRRTRLRNLRMDGRRIGPLFRDPLRRLRIAGDPDPGCAAAPDQAGAVGRHGRGRLAPSFLPAPFAAPPPVRRHPLGRAGRKRRLSQNRLPKSTARSMRSRRSDVGQFAQIPSS